LAYKKQRLADVAYDKYRYDKGDGQTSAERKGKAKEGTEKVRWIGMGFQRG
jgi:hypothetical protein